MVVVIDSGTSSIGMQWRDMALVDSYVLDKRGYPVRAIDYFADYAEYMIVVLLPEVAAALDRDDQHITEI